MGKPVVPVSIGKSVVPGECDGQPESPITRRKARPGAKFGPPTRQSRTFLRGIQIFGATMTGKNVSLG